MTEIADPAVTEKSVTPLPAFSGPPNLHQVVLAARSIIDGPASNVLKASATKTLENLFGYFSTFKFTPSQAFIVYSIMLQQATDTSSPWCDVHEALSERNSADVCFLSELQAAMGVVPTFLLDLEFSMYVNPGQRKRGRAAVGSASSATPRKRRKPIAAAAAAAAAPGDDGEATDTPVNKPVALTKEVACVEIEDDDE